MLDTVKTSKIARLAILLLIAYTAYWIYSFYILDAQTGESIHNTIFTVSYGSMALLGGITGLVVSRKWGGAKSILGRALLMFALGLFAQEFGQLAYTHWIYIAKLPVEEVYPSWGDIGYFGSIPFYTYGVILLGRASGITISLRSWTNKIIALLIPSLLLFISYYFLIRNHRTFNLDGETIDQLRTLLNFGYPIGQAIYISLALLTYVLSKKILGGIMRNKILFILFALLIQYVCDFVFISQSNDVTWVSGGVNDYMYLVSYFIMTLALLQLGTTYNRLRKDSSAPPPTPDMPKGTE